MVLRLLNPQADGAALHAIFGDAESCLYMPGPATSSVDETIALLQSWNEGTAATTWAIVESLDGDALGRVSMIPRGRDIWEAAIMIAPHARGCGLAFRALCEALSLLFRYHGARRVYADIDPENKTSIRLFERAGFKFEGRQRATWVTHIGVRDSFIYALLADDPQPAL